jgi:hypothetical protein
MKINCGPSRATTIARLGEWHDKFAIWPIRIGEDCYWLQTIERKGRHYCNIGDSFFMWDYRLKS